MALQDAIKRQDDSLPVCVPVPVMNRITEFRKAVQGQIWVLQVKYFMMLNFNSMQKQNDLEKSLTSML